VETGIEEVAVLVQSVDFSHATRIVDMFSGGGNITRAFETMLGRSIVCNDVNTRLTAEFHLDALQPSSYTAIAGQQGIHVVIMSPYFTILDLALPLAVQYAQHAVCCHVPGHYITDGPTARMQWLKGLSTQGRLAIIMGAPRGPSGRRCVWLIVYRSEAIKHAMHRLGFGQATQVHFQFHQPAESQTKPIEDQGEGKLQS
jgi:hypothetical protein